MMCIYCGVESISSTDGICPNCGIKNEPERDERDEEYVQAKPQSKLLDRLSDFFAGNRRE